MSEPTEAGAMVPGLTPTGLALWQSDFGGMRLGNLSARDVILAIQREARDAALAEAEAAVDEARRLTTASMALGMPVPISLALDAIRALRRSGGAG